MCTVVGASLLP
uniref:Uncharacterized protein n=1 Tax=Oryza meridionalis TaxID=40149 RepID=A0A0E0EAE5_9ORYZ